MIPGMDGIEFSIILVNWNGARDTLRCLDSLNVESIPEIEVLVVDNGSEDDSVARIRASYAWVRLIETGENLGFAEGCNRGIDASRGNWIFALNNDTVVQDGALDRLFSAAKASPPSIGMLQPVLVFLDRPERIQSTGVDVSFKGTAVDRDLEKAVAETDIDSTVFAVTAGAGLYRRSMLDAVRLSTGYFDRRHFMYWEDVDLGWRCRLAGFDARVVNDAFIHHAVQASSKRQSSDFARRYSKLNRIRTFLKNATWPLAARILTKRGRKDLVWLVGSAGGPAEIAEIARALWDGLRARREVSATLQASRTSVESRWLTP